MYLLHCTIVAVRLTYTNQVLLAVGVILLVIAIMVLIVVYVRTHKGNLVSVYHTLHYNILYRPGSRVGCGMVVLSIVLWVVVGFQVGLQKSEI